MKLAISIIVSIVLGFFILAHAETNEKEQVYLKKWKNNIDSCVKGKYKGEPTIKNDDLACIVKKTPKRCQPQMTELAFAPKDDSNSKLGACLIMCAHETFWSQSFGDCSY